MSEIRNWHYIDGPRRVGPFDDSEWAGLVRDGVVRDETRVWNEKLEGWVPYAGIAESFPLPEPEPLDEEEWEEPAEAPELFPPTPESLETFEAQALKRDYVADPRECLRRSWQLYKTYTTVLSGGTMLIWLMLLIGSSLPGGLGLLMPLGLSGTLQGGLLLLYLRLLRGEPAPVGTLFSGFRRGVFRHLVMRTLVDTAVNYLSLFAAIIALRMMGLRLEEAKDPAGLMEQTTTFFNSLDSTSFLTVLFLLFVFLLPTLFLKFFWMFATPLISDRGLPWSVAMRISWQKVQQHPVGAVRLVIYSALVAAAPALIVLAAAMMLAPSAAAAISAVVIVLFSLPLFIGSMMAFYEVVFPRTLVQEESRTREEAAEEA